MMNRAMRGVLLAGAAVAVPATVNAVIAARAGRVQSSLPGDIAYYEWVYGRVAFYRAGMGDPLLLVHHPQTGGSAWEWRGVFLELANRFTVYALDLLGFGLSEKPNIAYTGALYADLVHDFLQDVVGHPTAVAGSGLGASYLVNVAVRRPEALTRLVLVNPTGCTSTLPGYAATAGQTLLKVPVFGESAYNAMVSYAAIEHELKGHVYYDPLLVSPAMVHTQYVLAHQPGARYAAAAFIAGRLDLPMRMAFSLLQKPVLILWGQDAFYTPVSDAVDLLYRHPNARLEILDECGMLPHDERAGEFLRLTVDFFTRPEAMMGEAA
jgi:pimeloyl-ACP methyl ester carboxylesterase